ncbi:MAG: hypothetical protein ABH873_00935 [Candidatus Firestonebacteria bacterium]
MSNLVWIGNDRWPNPRTPKEFMDGIIKFEKPKTNEEMAISLYRWLHRILIDRDVTYEIIGNLLYHNEDVIKLLNIHCGHYCDGWGRLSESLWKTTGLPAKKVVLSREGAIHGHTETELGYKDNDGISRWHAMDIYHQVCVYTQNGERIASFKDLMKNPSLVDTPVKSLEPFYIRDSHKTNKTNLKYLIMPVESITFTPLHMMDIPLRIGEEVTRYWDNFGKFYVSKDNKNVCADGWHDPYPLYNDDGSAKDTINEPYYRQYLKECKEASCKLFGKRLKFYGNGEITYEPNISKDVILDGVFEQPINIDIEDGMIFPSKEKTLSCLVFEVKSPYIMVETELEIKFSKKDKYDVFEIFFSEGDPLNIRPLYAEEESNIESKVLKLKLGKDEFSDGKPSAYGRYKYLLRFQLLSIHNKKDTKIEYIKLKTVFQQNMFVLPRLLPGKNNIKVNSSNNDRLKTSYSYSDHKVTDKLVEFETNKRNSGFTIETNAENPCEVRCNYVKIKRS